MRIEVSIINKVKYMRHALLLCSLFIVLSVPMIVSAEDLMVYHNLAESMVSVPKDNQQQFSSSVDIQILAKNKFPTDLIISVDSSGSMSQNETMKKRLEVANKIIDLMDQNEDRIGFINWNEQVVVQKVPTSNFNEIKDLLNNVSVSQNITCIGKALNASISLLDDKAKDRKKAIIILSDGYENCSTDFDIKSILDRAKNSGITINAIIFDNDHKSNLLQNIAGNTGGQSFGLNDDVSKIINGEIKNITVTYAVPSSLNLSNYTFEMTPEIEQKNEIKILTWKINQIGQGQDWKVSFDVNSNLQNNFILGMSPYSKVNYIGNNGVPNYVLIPEKYLSFNSGFIGSQQMKEIINNKDSPFTLNGQGSAFQVRETITNMSIEKLILSNENKTSPQIIFRITTPKIDNLSLVMALDSSGSSSLNIPSDKKAIKEEVPSFLRKLEDTGVRANVSIISWDDNVDYINEIKGKKMVQYMPIDKTNQRINTLLSDLNFICLENETTDFDVGLGTSIDLMNYNKPYTDPYSPQILIFITGRSEFKNYTWQKYANSTLPNIYPIGLLPGKQMGESLEWLAAKSGGYYDNSGSTSQELNRVLTDDFKLIMDKVLYGNPIAYNVTVVDTLYPYLIPDESSIKVVSSSKNGTQKQMNIRHFIKLNKDRTNTLTLYLGNLTPESITEISFDAEFFMELPVDVTAEKREIKYGINNNTLHSFMSYEWHRGGKFSLDLPENKIVIRNGSKKSSIESGLLALVALIIIYFGRNRIERKKD